MRCNPVVIVFVLALSTLVQCRAPSAVDARVTGERDRPNVILFLVDDLGWKDLSCMGSALYRSPNIDALARTGMLFTRAYASSPQCSPTRHSIMTGMYPARSGMTAANGDKKQVQLEAGLGGSRFFPKAQVVNGVSRLDARYYTLAEAFKDNGYATGHFGKWHLGGTPYSPLEHGFDVDVPHYAGPGHARWYAPYEFEIHNGRFGGEEIPELPAPDGENIEVRMCDEAIAFIKANRNGPFFLNYWTYAVHAPFEAEAGDVDEFMQHIGPNAAQDNPVYASMVRDMDRSMGRLIEALDEEGLLDETIIVFASDNGGRQVPGPVYVSDFSGGKNFNRSAGHPLNRQTMRPTDNSPLRGQKGSIYEGGARVPMIVRAPGVTLPGSTCDDLVMSIDFYPTLVTLCELELEQRPAFDGVDLSAALVGDSLDRDTVFCHWPHAYNVTGGDKPATWVRKGDMKLIRFYCDGVWPENRYELYDLARDVGEMNDLSGAQQYAATIQELDTLIDQFLEDTGALVPVADSKYGTRLEDAAMRTWGSLEPSGASR